MMRELPDDEIPTIVALGRSIQADARPATASADGKTADFGRGTISVPLEDPAETAKLAAAGDD